MATTLPNAIRSAACDAIVDKVDQGSGAGVLRIRDSGGTVLASITLEDPAFGAASNGVATAASFPKTDSSADASGDAADYIVEDSDGTVIIGPVDVTQGSGSNQLINISIVATQPVTVNSLTFTVPATG